MGSGTPVALLLAAGRSRRFGSDKRRARFPDGRTLLTATAALYADVFDDVIVVLRHDDDPALLASLRTLRPGRIEPLRSARSAEGMGGSLADGAAAAPTSTPLVVALADMPWVLPRTLAAIRRGAEHLEGETVLQPIHGERPGHPVAFAPALQDALCGCSGDTGARALVDAARNAARVRTLSVDDPGILRDVDLPAHMLSAN